MGDTFIPLLFFVSLFHTYVRWCAGGVLCSELAWGPTLLEGLVAEGTHLFTEGNLSRAGGGI